MRVLLCLCCVLWTWGEDAGLQPVPLDDPFGLGERLVLISHLREQRKQTIPPDMTLDALRHLYWQLHQASDETARNATRERENLTRMRETIRRRFHQEPPEELDLAGLIDLREALIAESLAEVEAMAAAEQVERNLDLPQVIARSRAATVLITTDRSSGSGFFICPSGTLVTNHHVAPTIGSVVTVAWDADHRRKPERFRVERVDAERDTALLRPLAGSPPYPALRLGDEARLGQSVIACGFPLGASVGAALGTNAVDISVHRGSITALRRRGKALWFLQSDCALAQGNSGGPLIDETTGTVLGMIQSGLDPRDQAAMGAAMIFAIPIADVRNSLNLR